MNEKFYMISFREENTPTLKCENKEQAEKEAKVLSQEYGKEVFILETVSSVCLEKEVNERINSLEKACKYLYPENDAGGWISMKAISKYYDAIQAIYKLIIIAEAWNKADNFVPDFSDTNQYKYFPRFVYSGASAGFACAYTYYADSSAGANFGSRLCFKTRERAEQFGNQFIDLWNKFLLIK
jgi:hypothetical protein